MIGRRHHGVSSVARDDAGNLRVARRHDHVGEQTGQNGPAARTAVIPGDGIGKEVTTVGEELERAERLRREGEELGALLAALDARARTLRTQWLAGQARST